MDNIKFLYVEVALLLGYMNSTPYDHFNERRIFTADENTGNYYLKCLSILSEYRTKRFSKSLLFYEILPVGSVVKRNSTKDACYN